MPKCPCCHSEIKDFRGILFHDLDRAIYIDGDRYAFTQFEYRALKAIYDYGRPMPDWMLEAHLYGSCDGSKMQSIESIICKARAKLAGSRLYIPHRQGGGTGGGEGFRVKEVPK